MGFEILVGGNPAPYVFRASLSKNKQLPIQLAITNYATEIAFSPDKTKVAVSYGSSPYLKVFNVSDWSDLPRGGANPTNVVYGCAYSPDGALLAAATSASPYIYIYNTSDWTGFSPSVVPTAASYSCAFSPDGSLLAVSFAGGARLIVYNTSDWSTVTIAGGNPPTVVQKICFSDDGSMLAVASTNTPYLTVYDTSDWSKLTIPVGSRPTASVYHIDFSPDGSLLAVGYNGGDYYLVLNTADWSKVTTPNIGLTRYVRATKFSDDGRVLALGTDNGGFALLSTVTWEELQSPFALYPNSTVYCIAFSSEPKRTVSGNVRDIDGTLVQRTVRAYERDTGELCAETVSDPVTGEYVLELYEGDVEYDIQFMALEAESLNDLFYARVTSGAV